MDHEVIPRFCKIYGWLLNSSWGHFGLHQRKNFRLTMEFEAPKRHVLRPTLSINKVQRVLRWDRQNSCSGRKKNKGPWQRNTIIVIFYFFIFLLGGGRKDEDKRREKNGRTSIFPKMHFLDIYIF